MSDPTEFIQAVQSGDLEKVQLLVKSTPALIHAHNEQGVPMTLVALYHRHPAIFRFLISQKKEISFFEAIAAGRLEVVKDQLADAPANLENLSVDGFTPLGFSCYFNQEAVVHWLIDQGADVNRKAQNSQQVGPVHAAVAIQNLDLVRYLVEKGVDVNATQTAGIRPIHVAAHRGQIEMVKLLLDAGADPQALTEDGRTALQFARADGHEAVVALLEAYE